MSLRIEDYAIIGDTHTAALAGRDGSIDWLCAPRFDSGACFAALLGGANNGFWRLAPSGGGSVSSRRYRKDSLILENVFATPSGNVTVIDFMPMSDRTGRVAVVRIVKGTSGTVQMRSEAVFRFDYGRTVPWIRQGQDAFNAIAGPNAVTLHSTVPVQPQDAAFRAEFTIAAGGAQKIISEFFSFSQ